MCGRRRSKSSICSRPSTASGCKRKSVPVPVRVVFGLDSLLRNGPGGVEAKLQRRVALLEAQVLLCRCDFVFCYTGSAPRVVSEYALSQAEEQVQRIKSLGAMLEEKSAALVGDCAVKSTATSLCVFSQVDMRGQLRAVERDNEDMRHHLVRARDRENGLLNHPLPEPKHSPLLPSPFSTRPPPS